MADFDINATLYPIISGVVELMPSFLDLKKCKSSGFISGILGGCAYRHRDERCWVHYKVLGPDRQHDEILIGSCGFGSSISQGLQPYPFIIP